MRKILSMAMLVTATLSASSLSNYSQEEKSVYTQARTQGNNASKAKSLYLNKDEKCNVAYGRLELTSAQESHIDAFIKGFFEGCSNPKS